MAISLPCERYLRGIAWRSTAGCCVWWATKLWPKTFERCLPRRLAQGRLVRGAVLGFDLAAGDCALQGTLRTAAAAACRTERRTRVHGRGPSGRPGACPAEEEPGRTADASPWPSCRRSTARSLTSCTITANRSKRSPRLSGSTGGITVKTRMFYARKGAGRVGRDGISDLPGVWHGSNPGEGVYFRAEAKHRGVWTPPASRPGRGNAPCDRHHKMSDWLLPVIQGHIAKRLKVREVVGAPMWSRQDVIDLKGVAFHSAGPDRRHRLSEQGGALRPVAQGIIRDRADNRRARSNRIRTPTPSRASKSDPSERSRDRRRAEPT